MLDKSISWMVSLVGKITYSMDYRNGPNSYDCSSAVYHALIQAGGLPSMRIGNTDTLFGDLERNGWERVQENADDSITTKRGDVFIWGKRGASGGAFGHTGQFIDADNVVHCASGYNGMAITNHDWLWNANNRPEVTVYRFTGKAQEPPMLIDQIIEIGTYIKFDKVFTVDDVQPIGGVYQVRTNELCKNNFTWDDNGVPVDPLVEVTTDGYATDDQDLSVGSKYVIPGKFKVEDFAYVDDMWLALIEMTGLKLWVDVEAATEVAAGDGGTQMPQKQSAQQPPIISNPPPTQGGVNTDLPTVPPSGPPLTPPITTIPSIPKPTNDPKEDDMAFSKENAQEIQQLSEKVLDANEFLPVISDRTKTIAYFATDIGAILSGLLFTSLAIFHVVDALVAITLQTLITGALLGIKQTFRLSSKKQ